MPVKKKNSVYILFGIAMAILFGSLWWLNQTTNVREPFDNVWTNIGGKVWNAGKSATGYLIDNTKYININDEYDMRSRTDNVAYLATLPKRTTVESIEIAAYDPTVLDRDRTIYISNPNITGVSSTTSANADYSLSEITTDLLNENPHQNIQWDNVRLDNTRKNIITVTPMPRKPDILVDTCSTKGLIHSSFKKDMCNAYAGNYAMLNAKCQELSIENCKIPSCCVLLNGTSCVAGNKNGPIFTNSDTDFKYYYNKHKCYGNCDKAQSYESACSQYSTHSTGISKACMVQMFNNYGCPNSKPDALINDDMVASYSKTSKQYVDLYIKTAVTVTKRLKDNNLCYGVTSKGTGTDIDGYNEKKSKPPPADSAKAVGEAINTTIDDITSF